MRNKNLDSLFIYIVFFLLLALGSNAISAEIPDASEIYKGEGIDPERIVYSSTPSENIDPFTGSLTLVNTDLQLPGNGGLDLIINRVLVANKSRWKVGFGKILRNQLPDDPNDLVTMELQDGTVHYGYATYGTNNTEFKTKDFWKIEYPAIATEDSPPKVTTSDGTVITFGKSSPAGFLATSIRKLNNTITINYTTTASLTGELGAYPIIDFVVDTVGRRINFSHSVVGGIVVLSKISYCSDFSASCEESNENSITYNYGIVEDQGVESLPRLIEVLPPEGPPWVYTYTYNLGSFRLQSVMNPSGGVTSYTFGTFRKNINGAPLTYRQFLGVIEKVKSGRDVPTQTETFSYTQGPGDYDYTTIEDQTGRSTKISYLGYNKAYTNGGCWQVGLEQSVIVTDKDGDVESTVLNTWDHSAQTISETNHKVAGLCSDSATYIPRKTEVAIVRDGQTYSTLYQNYDDHENPKTIVESGDIEKTTTLTYWKNASLNIVKDKPETISTTSADLPGSQLDTVYGYNTKGQQISVTNNGVVTQQGYDSKDNIAWIEDANSRRTNYSWSNGRISRIEKHPTNDKTITINRVINSDGTIKSVTNGRGFTTSFEYDGLKRIKKIVPPTSPDSPASPITFNYPEARFSYNGENYFVKAGVIKRRHQQYVKTSLNGFNRPTREENHLGISSTITYIPAGLKYSTTSDTEDTVFYDSHGRVTKVVHKDDSEIQYDYTGSNVVITDEELKTTTHHYKAFGNPDDKLLFAITDANQITTNYEYSLSGALTKATVGDGASKVFQYNSKHFLSSSNQPESGKITYDRDNVGNLKKLTDGQGAKSYDYDFINRLTKITTDSDTINFDYDDENNLISNINASAQITYSYDRLNRITTKSEVIAGKSYTTQFRYDENDNIRKIIYPSAREVIYVYNALGQVTSIPGYVDSITYYDSGTAIGQIQSITANNGTKTDFSYTSRNLMSGVNANGIFNKKYSYADKRGNLTAMNDTTDLTDVRSFTYDNLNRLKGFSGPWGGGEYQYHSNGNRKSKTIGTEIENYTYVNNKLTSDGQAGFNYNTSGDLSAITRNGVKYNLFYDPLHNMTSYKEGSNTLATFQYDGNNMRVTKHDTVNDSKIIYHYDQNGNIISEDNGSGMVIADYIYLNNILIAKIENPEAVPSNDSDNDGLSDSQESLMGTSIDNPDSDGDGITDGAEKEYWGDSWNMDIDEDGLINILDSDADGDGFCDGAEVYHELDPGEQTSYPDQLLIETGTIEADDAWQEVVFTKTFFSPVVVATITGAEENTEPASVRIRNVTSDGFSLRLQEGNYADGTHPLEEVSYIVMEAGRYVLTEGEEVVAGSFNHSTGNTFTTVPYGTTFSTVPVTMASITTFNDASMVNPVLNNIGKSTFSFKLQPEEGVSTKHGMERIDFIAWEASNGVSGSAEYEVASISGVTHTWKAISFNDEFPMFSPFPVVAAIRQSYNGGDPATILIQDRAFFGFSLRIAEDTANDGETNHVAETVGYIAVSQSQNSIPPVEIVQNYDFTGGSTGWGVAESGGGTVLFSDGQVILSCVSDSGCYAAITQTLNVEARKELTYEIDMESGSPSIAVDGWGEVGTEPSGTVTPLSYTVEIRIMQWGLGTTVINSVSLRQ